MCVYTYNNRGGIFRVHRKYKYIPGIQLSLKYKDPLYRISACKHVIISRDMSGICEGEWRTLLRRRISNTCLRGGFHRDTRFYVKAVFYRGYIREISPPSTDGRTDGRNDRRVDYIHSHPDMYIIYHTYVYQRLNA